jgi:hypothetical protein
LPKISAAGWAAVFVNSFSPEWPPCSLEIWSQGNSLGKSPPAGRLCVQRIRFNAKSAPRAPFFLCSLQALLGDSTGVLGEVEAVVGCSSVSPPSASSVPTVVMGDSSGAGSGDSVIGASGEAGGLEGDHGEASVADPRDEGDRTAVSGWKRRYLLPSRKNLQQSTAFQTFLYSVMLMISACLAQARCLVRAGLVCERSM